MSPFGTCDGRLLLAPSPKRLAARNIAAAVGYVSHECEAALMSARMPLDIIRQRSTTVLDSGPTGIPVVRWSRTGETWRDMDCQL
jgi:hypothetical protein